MCNILCIDAGWSSLGWCYFKDGKSRFGEMKFNESDKAMRAKVVAKDLMHLIDCYKPVEVICEDFVAYGPKGTRAQNVAVTIGILVGICVERNIGFKLVNHNHWKAKWKKLENQTIPSDIGEHALDAFMMGIAMEAKLC